jgi:hypothetical protein
LPEESAFVAAEREAMLVAGGRVTTAQARGAIRGGGRGRRNAGSQRGSGVGARGKGKKRKKGEHTETSAGGRARRKVNGSGDGRGDTSSTNAEAEERAQYRIGPGSAHHLLFGDEDAEQRARRDSLPDLNEDVPFDEVQISQNAPH